MAALLYYIDSDGKFTKFIEVHMFLQKKTVFVNRVHVPKLSCLFKNLSQPKLGNRLHLTSALFGLPCKFKVAAGGRLVEVLDGMCFEVIH